VLHDPPPEPRRLSLPVEPGKRLVERRQYLALDAVTSRRAASVPHCLDRGFGQEVRFPNSRDPAEAHGTG
jgi:hypothetical protein